MASPSYRDYQRRTEARRLGRQPEGRDLGDGESENELHHLRVHLHAEGSRESPKWVVVHHYSEDGKGDYKLREFVDGTKLLQHLGKYAGLPGFESEGEEEKES
jgi:hypothetical protein